MILETLYILFKSNTDDVEKGAKKAKKTTDDLNNSLLGTSEAGKKIGGIFFEVASYFTAMATAAVSVYALVDGLKEAFKYTSQLDLSSRSIGLDVADIDKWGNALRRTGGDAKSFEQNVRNLSQHTGLTPTVALQFLPALADSLRKLSYVQAVNFGQAFGLDLPMITLLRQTNTELDKLLERQEYLGVVTDKDQVAAQDFNFALQDTSHALRNMFISLGTEVLPVLTGLLNHLIPVIVYLRQNKDILIGGFVAVGVVVSELVAPLVAANAELILMGAAIGGIAATFGFLYGDIKNFSEGTDSFLGQAADKWPVLGKIIQNTLWAGGEAFKSLKDTGTVALNSLENAAGYLRWELEVILSTMQKIYEFFGGNARFRSVITTAQEQLDTASSSPISAQTSTSIFNSRLSGDREVKLDIQQITINAPTGESESILETLRRELSGRINDAINHFDTPVVK